MADIPFLQAHPHNYRQGRTAPIRYLVIHYTANNGDTAQNNARYYGGTALKDPASAHYFVDEREIWQSVRDSDTAFHCGTKGAYRHPTCRNSNSIGIELCSRKTAGGVYYFKPETVERAARLSAALADKHNISAENIIRHHDVTGKICPAPMVEAPENWTAFQARVEELRKLGRKDEDMKDYPEWAKRTYKWIDEMPEWAQSAARKAVKKGIVATNTDNSVTLLGVNLQTLVYLDRAGLLN